MNHEVFFRAKTGITNAGVWAASTSYIAQSFEPEYRISTQGVLQGMNHGFGKGLGAIIGGAVTTYYGTLCDMPEFRLLSQKSFPRILKLSR